MKKDKNKTSNIIETSPLSEIIYAATTGKSLKDVNIQPTVENLITYNKIKAQAAEIRESGQGVIIPN